MSEETWALTALIFVISLGLGIGLFGAYIEPIENFMERRKKRRAKPA